MEETEHLWIEMADGVRLAARLWQPRAAGPVPAILEYIPYRKADMVRARDERNHLFLAAHGYACIRVDMRGSGDSEGHMPDMYAPAELADARHVIAWLAAQSWCDGRVGMFGTSWGGTAALQASADAPEALKAVIAVSVTHDRFEDDIHYMGGCVLSDSFEWGATLPAILASPPTPEVGPDWMARWRARVETLSFPLEHWLREDGRGDYWRHGSVIHRPEALSVPILAVGGWSDRYSASVMALVDARPDLVWGIVGPWGHHYPDQASPGPGIGFQRLALEWWDHWLKPRGSAPIAWPRLRVWLRTFDPPADRLEMRQGGWIETGPARGEIETRLLDLTAMAVAAGARPWNVPSDPAIGTASGDTGYFGRVGGLPLDQSTDDDRALVFETAPLGEELILYGAVTLHLTGTTSTGGGRIVARLSDVDGRGQAARITYGLRNLALDEALDHSPKPRQPGPFAARLGLHNTAYRLRKGHRLRLALSQNLWPLIYSGSPDDTVSIATGTIVLALMRTPPRALATPFPPVEDLPAVKSHELLRAPALIRWHNATVRGEEIGWHQPLTRTRFHRTGTVFGFETRANHRLHAGQPQETEIAHRLIFERPDGHAEIASTLHATHDRGNWEVRSRLEASWNGDLLAERDWQLRLGAKR